MSRLVPRKGQDTLIRALPAIRRRVPDAALLLVGGGPYRSRLWSGWPREDGVAAHVVFTGTVPWAELPAHYAAGDVFAMPCRTRRGGLDVEGLGIVYLEASATGLPVVAGDSGGAPDAVRAGETGYVVPGRDVDALADRVVQVLADPALASRLGAAGRAWVEADWRWDTQADRLAALLGPGSRPVIRFDSVGRIPSGRARAIVGHSAPGRVPSMTRSPLGRLAVASALVVVFVLVGAPACGKGLEEVSRVFEGKVGSAVQDSKPAYSAFDDAARSKLKDAVQGDPRRRPDRRRGGHEEHPAGHRCLLRSRRRGGADGRGPVAGGARPVCGRPRPGGCSRHRRRTRAAPPPTS